MRIFKTNRCTTLFVSVSVCSNIFGRRDDTRSFNIYSKRKKKFKQLMNPCSLSTGSTLHFVLVGFSRSKSVSGERQRL